MLRTASTTSPATLLAGAALFAALTACAVSPASAIANPAAAVKWNPVNDGWDAKNVATLEAAFSAVSRHNTLRFDEKLLDARPSSSSSSQCFFFLGHFL